MLALVVPSSSCKTLFRSNHANQQYNNHTHHHYNNNHHRHHPYYHHYQNHYHHRHHLYYHHYQSHYHHHHPYYHHHRHHHFFIVNYIISTVMNIINIVIVISLPLFYLYHHVKGATG